jgi:hypothetical protein
MLIILGTMNSAPMNDPSTNVWPQQTLSLRPESDRPNIRQAVHDSGYALLSGFLPDSSTLSAASDFGTVAPVPGLPNVQILVPAAEREAKTNSDITKKRMRLSWAKETRYSSPLPSATM